MPIEGGALGAATTPPHLALRLGLETKPDALAMVSATRRMTWREVDEESSRLAAGYRRLGLEPGDRIASLMPNRIALALHYLACFKAGLVATPLNYRYATPEVDHALEVSGASALLVHAERADDVAASRLAPELRCGVVSYGRHEGPGRRLDALLATESEPGMSPPDPSSPAAIFFTSGSTGPAKGVTHTHETLGWMSASAIAAFELTAEDTFLPGSSMSHLGSFLWTLSSLAVGAPVV